jgi:galactokinase
MSTPSSEHEDREGPSFWSLYGRAPQYVGVARGRVNLMGDHTDYNAGLVLPACIPQSTCVEIAPRADMEVHAWSREQPSAEPLEYMLGSEERAGGWLDYIKGVTRALSNARYGVHGFDLRIESTVPVGSGLSSSAALEVALLRGLRAAFDLPLDDLEMALLAHRAETELVGAPVGILDPFACTFADTDRALFLDTQSIVMRTVAIPPEIETLVVFSGVTHDHANGDYRVRRAECDRAAELLGVPKLRAATPSDLRAAKLPAPLDRRARHVVSENERVTKVVAAFEQGDLAGLGALFAASHRSLRDDFEVSVPLIERLVAIAAADPAVVGARLTGGGFGGSIVALAHRGEGRAAAERIAAAFDAGAPGPATILVPPRAEAALEEACSPS